MLFGLPSLMLKSTKKKFSSFTAYWWWSNSLHLSRFHEYSWKIVFIIFNPTARKKKNLKCLEVHGKLKRSQRHENRKLTKDAYTHMYYRDWWNSLHESLKEPVKLQYELLVNKRISCRSVAPGLKKNWDGWPGSPSDWFRPGATYRQLQANARLAAWVERCCIKKNSDLLSTMVLFFFSHKCDTITYQMFYWHKMTRAHWTSSSI